MTADTDTEHGRKDEKKAEQPTITFGESAAETVVEAFGWETDSVGYIQHADTGKLVKTTDGHPIQISNLAGIVPDKNGEPTPLRDDFTAIVDHVKKRRQDD